MGKGEREYMPETRFSNRLPLTLSKNREINKQHVHVCCNNGQNLTNNIPRYPFKLFGQISKGL
jgi:hypothetical protein